MDVLFFFALTEIEIQHQNMQLKVKSLCIRNYAKYVTIMQSYDINHYNKVDSMKHILK